MKNRVLVQDPAGKMLKIFVDCDERINEVIITGDFFAHPEKAMDELQDALKGIKPNGDDIRNALENFLRNKEINLYGISQEGIYVGIMKCLGEWESD